MQLPFVHREHELTRLSQYLQRIYDKKREVCFIAGEAGSGKSTLIHQFSIIAQKKHKDLLFLVGTCNDQIGIGDSYLPFRQIMYQLLGDSDSNLDNDVNSNRLRQAIKTTGRALIEVSPELIGTLIPGTGILMALGKFAADEIGWLDPLKKVAERSRKQPPQLLQDQLMSQYTALLQEISEDRPLVIVLDDLQWADEASMILLFHLIRELDHFPVMFIGMYRPNDINIDRNGSRHPLQSILNEIKRYHGDVWIDLDEAQSENGRDFLDALLDSIPNQFDQAFRDNLYKLTSGHPLFTTEIILNMQRNGHIHQDAKGTWITSAALNWEEIPAKIEAIIDERIDRLDEKLQDLLFTASVEGQVFTAQIVAEVIDDKLRNVLRCLSRELDQQHHLVRELGKVHTKTGILYQHTFSNKLYRQYLYSMLGDAEKTLLHGDIAELLESLYGDDNPSIAGLLAHHHTKSGNPKLAVKYLIKASEYNISVGDTSLARAHIDQAFNSLYTLTDNEQAQLQYLLAWCEYRDGNNIASEKAFRASVEIADAIENWELANRSRLVLADLLRELGKNTEALNQFQIAIRIATSFNNHAQLATALWGSSIIHRRTGEYQLGLEMLNQALIAAKVTDDDYTLIQCYNSLAIHHRIMGNLDLAEKHYRSAIKLAENDKTKTNQHAMVLDNLAGILRHQGRYSDAIKMSRMALEKSLKTRNLRGAAHRHATLAFTYYYMQDLLNVRNEISLGSSIAERFEDIQLQANFRMLSGMITLSLGEYKTAVNDLLRAHELKYRNLEPEILAFLAIGLLRANQVERYKEITHQALGICNNIIRDEPNRYGTYCYKGAILASLAIKNTDNSSHYIAKSSKSYKRGMELLNAPGWRNFNRIVLDQLKPLDTDNILQPIYTLLENAEDAEG